MTGVLGGFAALAVVIAVGWFVGRVGLLGEQAPAILSWLSVVLKTLVQPVIAWGLGQEVAGLDGTALLAVVVTSALPTAQNVFVHASTCGRGTVLARDVILLSTVLSVPVLVVVAVVLG